MPHPPAAIHPSA
jgi:hypothetical protein